MPIYIINKYHGTSSYARNILDPGLRVPVGHGEIFWQDGYRCDYLVYGGKQQACSVVTGVLPS